MAEIKSFPNNQDTSIGAENVMRWLHGRTSGIFGADGNGAVTAVQGEMAVEISDATGWMANENGDGVVWWIDNEKELGVKLRLYPDLADGILPRIDRVIISWPTTDYVARPTASILKGAAASTPHPPALTNNSLLRQISLARITIAAGTITITPDMITDERLDDTVCGIVTDRVNVDTSVINAQFNELLQLYIAALADANIGVLPIGSVSTEKLADGAVTKEKIAPNATITALTAKLLPTGWADKQQTVNAEGLTVDPTRAVIISPAPESLIAYGEAAVRCISQGEGTLTFQCEDVPTAELTVNVAQLT